MNSNEKTRDKRGFLQEQSSNLTCVADRVEPTERRKCPDIGTPPAAECLLPCRCDPGGALHQPACTANQALWRAWVQLRNLGKRLTCTLQIAFGQIDFAQPVLGIARVLAVRVFAQESGEGLAGLVEVLGFDQVEGSIVIELFLRRITRFAARGRGLGGYRSCTCCCTGGIEVATSGRIIRSRGWCNA